MKETRKTEVLSENLEIEKNMMHLIIQRLVSHDLLTREEEQIIEQWNAVNGRWEGRNHGI